MKYVDDHLIAISRSGCNTFPILSSTVAAKACRQRPEALICEDKC